jgi:RNA polymerase primary sigma factor
MEQKTAERRAAGDGQGTMGIYLRDVRRIPQLSMDEEQACARMAARGDEGARERLVQANLRFVIMVARQYQGRGVPLEDLVSEGNIGLIQAARRFDPDRGVRFVSYAVWWIRQAMLQALRGGLRQAAAAMLSLDWPAGDDGEGEPLLSRVADPNALLPETALAGVELTERVGSALAGLPAREARILRDRFGLAGRARSSLRETGRKHGLSNERVRQIEKRALRRIRGSVGACQLTAYAN